MPKRNERKSNNSKNTLDGRGPSEQPATSTTTTTLEASPRPTGSLATTPLLLIYSLVIKEARVNVELTNGNLHF